MSILLAAQTAWAHAPVANNDSYTTDEDVTLTVNAPGVLANDTDADGQSLTAIRVSNPSHGTLTLNANGSFIYRPATNYNGPDSFTYKARDGGNTSGVATVSITVRPADSVGVTNCVSGALPDPAYGATTGGHALYLPGIGTDFVFTAVPGTFVQFPDGTATLTGTAFRQSNPQKGFVIDVQLSGYRTTPPSGSPKKELSSNAYVNGGPVDTDTWVYYTSLTGTLTGVSSYAGAVLSIVRTGPSFQVGFGASGKNINFGASSWFNWTVTRQPNTGTLTATGQGDFNIDLFPCNNDDQCVTNANGDATYSTSTSKHAVYLPGIATDFIFTPPGRFTQNSDGTATITGLAVSRANARNAFQVNVQLSGYTTDVPPGSPKKDLKASAYVENGGPVNPATWSYYTSLEGTLTGVSNYAGAVLNIVRTGPAFQIGVGANGKNIHFGASSWFKWTVARQPNSGSMSSGQGDFNLDIIACAESLALTCPGASGQAFVPYSSALVASGGTPPYTFSIVSGSLPAGLTLNPASGAITGTPTTGGTFGFTAKVTDAAGATALSLCTSGCSSNTASWDFLSPLGTLGTVRSYTENGWTLTARGYLNNGTPTALYGKNEGGDEDGLGIANVSTHEITTANFIQLDLRQLIASGAGNARLAIGSVQAGEGYSIYGSHAQGTLGTLLLSNGTLNNTFFAMPGYPSYEFISVRASKDDVLIYGVTVSAPSCTITIGGGNRGPVANDDNYTTPSDTTLTIAAPGVLVNDSDPDGDALTALLVSGPTRGTVTLSANGSFVYTPNAGFSGTDTFTYRANDGKTNSNLATVTITVPFSGIVIITPPRNQTNCPGETATFSVTATGTALTYRWIFGTNVLANRTNSTLVLTNVQASSAGTYCVVLTGAGSGPITNCALLVVNQNVIVTTPLASQTSFVGSNVVFSVNASGTALRYQWFFNGAAIVAATNSTLTLNNITTNQAGSYCIMVSGVCGIPVTACATLTIQNRPPIARDDSYTTPSDTTLTIAAPGVLVNDSDPDGDALTALLVGAPTRGTVTLNANGSFVYVPNPGFAGTNTFTYRANDGKTNSNLATVTITVQSSGIVITTPPRNQTNCPGETATFSVTATGTALRYQWLFGATLLANQTNGTLVLTNVNAASAGTYCVVLTGAGSGPITNCALLVVNQNVIVTTPPANQTVCPGGTAIFSVTATGTALTYQWSFGTTLLIGQTSRTLGLSNVIASQAGTYRVIVSGACGGPVTNSATLTVSQNVIVVAPPVNQTNVVGGNVTFSVGAIGAGLRYQWFFNGSVVGTNSTLPLNNITANQAGTYCVVVSGACGTPATNCATLTILNRPPVARDDTYTTPEDTTLVVTAPGILANDSDPDGDTLTAVLLTEPARGTLILSNNGSFIYRPFTNFTGDDTFLYHADDGIASSSPAVVRIKVEPRPDRPIARDDSYTTLEDTALIIAAPGVLANDSDPDGDALRAVFVSGPTNGIVALSTNGSFIYVPNTGYNGPDSFTYKASDGSLESGVATVRITVTPMNDPPTVMIVSPTNGTIFIAPANFNVIADANDSDGVVTNVQIFSGANLIGSFATAPYLVPQTNLPPGIYTYFATATDNDGLRATSSVVIVTVTSSPPVTALGPIVLNRQNGLFEHFVRVSNPTPDDFVNGVRVFAELVSDNPSNRVWNATGTNASGVAFVDSPTPLPSGGSIVLLIQYYLPEPRSVPTVTLTAVPLPFAQPALPQPKVMDVWRSGSGAVIEFTTVKNYMYYLQCSDDLVHWTTIPGLLHGTGSRMQGRDPGSAPSRFYRAIVIR